jgi:hypothetical protein
MTPADLDQTRENLALLIRHAMAMEQFDHACSDERLDREAWLAIESLLRKVRKDVDAMAEESRVLKTFKILYDDAPVGKAGA